MKHVLHLCLYSIALGVAPLRLAAQTNGALQFDGVGSYVTFGVSATLNVSNFTVECWFKRQGTGVTTTSGSGGLTATPLVTRGRSEGDGSNVDCNFFLGLNSTGPLAADFEDYNNGLNHPIVGVSIPSSGVWNHAAVTYDVNSGTWVLYLNGVPDATNVIAGTIAVRTPRYDSIQHAGLATALNSSGVAAGFFNGALDEVRIWNYARSAAQISTNYTLPITNAPGLVARWALDDGSGTTTTNSIPGGVSGTLVNGPVWTTVNASGTNSPPALTRGPYLQLSTPTSIVIRWRTDVAADSRVGYGTNLAALNLTNTLAAPVTEHIVTLTNLQPDTQYFYSISSGTNVLAGPSTNHFFLTHPLPGTTKPIRVWVIGDAGTAPLGAGPAANQAAVRNAFQTYNGTNTLHAWLQLGDNAYNEGTDAQFQTAVFDMYTNQLRNSVTWPTLGNHETAQLTAFVDTYPYFDMFTLPTAGEAGGAPSATEHWYSFDLGMVHFVCLDSMTANRATNGAMADWLRTDLALNTNRWVIAFFHHPPYSRGSHDSDVGGVGYNTQMGEMRTNFLPILEAGGVDLVLCGHSHSYERSKLINGHYGLSTTFNAGTHVIQTGSGRETNGTGEYLKPDGHGERPVGNRGTIYAVAGSSGQTSAGTGFNHPAMYYSAMTLGSMVLDFKSNRLDAVFLRETGATDDWFTIIKEGTNPPRLTNAVTAGNNFQFTVLCRAYRTNIVEASSNVAVGWTGIFTNLPTAATFNFTDTNALAAPQKFYRVRKP